MNLSIIGLQWGDEGKGKIIDLFSIYSDIVIRYNGGHNAGHIIYIKNKKNSIRILPSGIFKKNCLCLLSENVIFSIENFLKEKNNLKYSNLIFSNNIILNNLYDEIIDYLFDKILKIGTTYSGISITYLRKQIKCCFKINELFKIIFFKNINKCIFIYNIFFIFFNVKIKIIKKIFFNKFKLFFYYKNIIINNNNFVNNKYNKIFESSQGGQLDIDCGTYPYVTCSNTINKSIYINSKFFLNKIKFIGILKSYSTRVGNGFFISKFSNEKSNLFSLLNYEFGTNSLRIRNSGWLDLFSILNMVKINNISNLIITRMDSYIFLKYIKIIINYKFKKKYNFISHNIQKYNFIILNSWNFVYKKYIDNEKSFHLFIRLLEKLLNTAISIISIGKSKFDIIVL